MNDVSVKVMTYKCFGKIPERFSCDFRIFKAFCPDTLGSLGDVLTRQEVVLCIQQGTDGLHPCHLDAGAGGLQCEPLGRASGPQHELAGVTIHTVLHC